MEPKAQLAAVSQYYGETLQSSNDLRTSACCPVDAVPPLHQRILKKLHPDILARFYGCGSPIPTHLRACSVLDLGCGTGRDAFVASALVGTAGRVVGVDMTDAQLAVARAHTAFHAAALLGPDAQPNVAFRAGLIEDLAAAGVADASADVVISNCVCNLSPDKRAVFAGVHRALRANAAELYFSDVYASKRLSAEAREHPTLVAECLGGALYVADFVNIMRDVGFHDVRVVSAAPIALHDAALKRLVPDVDFYSLTVRAFKLDALEPTREDYGQTAVYTPVPSAADDAFEFADDPTTPFRLDVDNVFAPGVPVRVDANTAAILSTARFRSHFTVSPRATHTGPFRLAADARPLGDVLDVFRPAPPARAAPFADVGGCPPSACGPPAAQQSDACCPPAQPTAPANGACAPKSGGSCGPSSTACAPANGASAPKSGGSCSPAGAACAPAKGGCGPTAATTDAKAKTTSNGCGTAPAPAVQDVKAVSDAAPKTGGGCGPSGGSCC